MKANLSQFLGRAGLLTGTLLLLTGLPALGADKANADAFPDFESYVKISGQVPSISGNAAAFSNRTAQPNNGAVGIEDLHITKELNKTTTLVIDGRALSGAEDYLGKINLVKNEVGTVDIGYKHFRTFYDGAGGFFPLNNQWNKLDKEERHTDRSKFWAEATLALPNAPVFTVRYTNELRNGSKDSTIWGSSDFTGLPLTLAPNPINQSRKMTPGLIRLNERHEDLELTVKHKIKNTSLQLTLLGDRTKNLDSRTFTNYPGEVLPWYTVAALSNSVPTGQLVSPQNAAKALLAPANWNNQAFTEHTEGTATKASGATFEADTVFNDKLSLHIGANYELLHSDLSGTRYVITATPTLAGVLAVRTSPEFADLAGGSRIKSYTGNIALSYKASKDLFVKVGLRAQDEYIRGSSTYSVVAATVTGNNTSSPVVTTTTTPRLAWSKLHQKVQTPVLDLRYTGINNLALYFTGSLRSLNGEEHNSSAFNPLTAAAGNVFNNDVSEDHGDYVGASWKMSQRLSLRAEVFTKGHDFDSVGTDTIGAQVGNYYLLESRNKGYKLTAVLKPNSMVSATTRFVSQRSKMKVTGFLPAFPAYDSLDGKTDMISESIDITPNASCYVQLNASAIFNVISTAYPRAGVKAAVVNATTGLTTANAYDTNKQVQNSDNNYLTGSVLAGYVVNKDTDVQLQANYYKADNNNLVLAPWSMPYGVAVRDVSYTVGVKLKVSDTWICHAKVGYFDSQNDTFGGFANYKGPVAYFAFDHAL